MTREEALIKYEDMLIDNGSLVHSIYDEFENRKCENCKYIENTYLLNIGSYTCTNSASWMNNSNIIKSFYCNKWESK